MSRERFIAAITGRPLKGWTIATIVMAVARETGIPRREIVSDNRSFPVAHARQEAMRRAYATGKFSLPQIGKFFGRDHTTVLHGIRRATERAKA
jgi:chromosomal replication initiator protein